MIYDKIKLICKKKKIPISRIEADLGLSSGSICKWNTVSPSVEKVKKVANYLSVDINKII